MNEEVVVFCYFQQDLTYRLVCGWYNAKSAAVAVEGKAVYVATSSTTEEQ
jgi:hypothetical protein